MDNYACAVCMGQKTRTRLVLILKSKALLKGEEEIKDFGGNAWSPMHGFIHVQMNLGLRSIIRMLPLFINQLLRNTTNALCALSQSSTYDSCDGSIKGICFFKLFGGNVKNVLIRI